MKKIIFIALLAGNLSVNSQYIPLKAPIDTLPSKQVSNKDELSKYLLKSKRQSTFGFILLTTGLVTSLTATAISLHDLGNIFEPGGSHSSNSAIIPILTYSGLGMIVCSIPVLISSGKNRRLARLYLKKNSFQTIPGFNKAVAQTSVGLKIDF